MSNSFEDFLEDDQWLPLDEHLRNYSKNLEKNINLSADNHKRLKVKLRGELVKRYHVKKFDQNLADKLKIELYSGNVAGVDGTCSDIDLITGFQARIGIVSVSYSNKKATYTATISEPFTLENTDDIQEQMKHLRLKGMGKIGITSSHIRAIMLFKERDFILKRPEKYKFVQGDVLPYELRTGQGRLRGLSACLKLGRKILDEEYLAGVQASTSRPELRWLGSALEPGEYVELYDYAKLLDAFLEGDDFTQPANFNPQDYSEFRDFNNDVRKKFSVGLYKVKSRSYVIYAPSKKFEEMVHLAYADSLNQPLRGFPLLLDYADMICSRLFSTRDFVTMVHAKLAKQKLLESEIDEHLLRRR
jgi:hypothetical protein